jgi:hypothetical protein
MLAPRALDAEIVVGIDVSYRPEEAVLNNAVDVALQAFSIATVTSGVKNSRRPTW